MNDWENLYEILKDEAKKELETGESVYENPLLKNAVNYMYGILEFLVDDVKEGNVAEFDDETKKIVQQFAQWHTGLDMKTDMLDRDREIDIEYKKEVMQRAGKIFENKAIKEYLNSNLFYATHRIKKCGLHQKICKEIFENIDNNNEIFVSVEWDTEEEARLEEFFSGSEEHIKLEVVSAEILAYDEYVFDRLEDPGVSGYIREIYRPYLVEYYVDARELNQNQRLFLQRMYENRGWYKAALTDEIDTDEGNIFGGTFIHSASPVVYQGRKIKIIDSNVDISILNSIKKTYDTSRISCCKDADIKKELEELFADVRFETTRVYKVGNGNCIYNYGKKGTKEMRFFYDIGFDMSAYIGKNPTKRSKNQYIKALYSIGHMKPECVILSHWDEDHFRACVYANKAVFEKKWVAPYIYTSENKANAKRLFLYLYKIGSLMVVQRGIARDIVVQHGVQRKMTLFVGKRQKGTDKKITKCNCEGIALYLENDTARYGKIKCLMQGDVPYMSLPLQTNFAKENPYTYLVAPHHGAEMDCSMLMGALKKDGQAVICCTNDTSKNRPEINHLNALTKCYDKVECTETASHYIQFDLRKKKVMNIV